MGPDRSEASAPQATPPDLPDPQAAREAVRAWATSEAHLGALLLRGLPTVDAVQRWGVQLLKEGRASDAATAFRAAAALAPNDANPLTNLGVALDRTGSPAHAAFYLERSVAMAKAQPHTWLLLGIVRQKLGDRDGAEAAYRVAIDQEPSGLAAWQCLGVLKQEQRAYLQAIACFEECLARGDHSAAVYANIGKLSYQTCRVEQAHEAYGRAERAEPSNLQYRRMARNTRFVLDVLQGTSLDDALATYRAAGADIALYVDADLVELFEGTCGLLATYGHLDAALRASKKRLELWPDSASARYLFRAIGGDTAIDRSPPEYIVESFDAFAAGFDAKLVGALGYDVPETLCDAVRQAIVPGAVHDVLDAGCGTGLCGVRLRPMARSLVGADLSAKMLELAARRGVYDELVRDEVTAFLTRSGGRFDVVVAADVMIYFGDLGALLGATATAIRPGGLLAFSTESIPTGTFLLRPSGRFAHAPAYVEQVAAGGFAEQRRIETTIRLDGDSRVPGNLFLFRRR